MSQEKKTQDQNFKFQAEVSQLLQILTHSLYTHRDVFIRELVSNASDALDKVRFKDVKGEEVSDSNLDLEIRIELDKDNKTFTIKDTGIGMTKDELVSNIGTIARSGTSEFLKQVAEESAKDVNLIGRFGVGFYSVFMAAEKVELTTKSAQKDATPYVWISDGQGSFTIQEGPADTKRGTCIKVFLREDAQEFGEKYTVQHAIEKYSNFVPFPIYLDKERINNISAIWREPKSSVKKKDYNEFFKFIAHQGDDAITWMHFSADVPLQFNSLLFVPKTNLEWMGFGKEEEGIHLFVKRVLIDAKAKEILPPYLRFVKGVLESDDLPLNISRETLQENPYVLKIRNTVVSKFLTHLKEFSEKEPEKYAELWKAHGRIMKEGYTDFTHKEKVAELFRYNSSACKKEDELVSLSTYVERMAEGQEEIYFLSGPSREALDHNPKNEIFKSKGIEVLYSFDPIDEFVLPGLMEFQGKKIISADQADLDTLSKVNEEKSEEKPKEVRGKKDFEKLARRIKDILGNKVENVVLSERLVDSPAVLLNPEKGMSAQMEKIMHMVNKDSKLSKKVLEINPKHTLVKNMLKIYKGNAKDPLLSQLANNLYHSVLLLDGAVEDPNEMVADLQKILTETAKLYQKSKAE